MNGRGPGRPTPVPTSELPAPAVPSSVDDWIASLSGGGLGALLSRPAEEQARLGYAHTLREIHRSR